MATNVELWVEYSIGTFFFLFRFFARWKVVGFSNFRLDDIFIFIAMIVYAPVTALIQVINNVGSAVGQTEESVLGLSPQMVEGFVLGGKLAFTDWILYMVYVWSLKAALLSMYWKLASGLKTHMMIIKGVAVFTAITFVICELTHILQCVPVQRGWQVIPYPGDECTARNLNYYVIGILNAVTDGLIVAIPVPILLQTNLSLLRKLGLLVLLCSGVFVILATILRAYYSLQSIQTLAIAMDWASRETFVAAVAVSVPGIKPFFSQSQWFRSLRSSRGGKTTEGKSNQRTHGLVTIGGSEQPAIELGAKGKSQWRVGTGKELKGTRLSSDGSEEYIMEHGNGSHGDLPHSTSTSGSPAGAGAPNAGIQITSEYTVSANWKQDV